MTCYEIRAIMLYIEIIFVMFCIYNKIIFALFHIYFFEQQ
jgi:hypothetical protein